MYYLNAKDSMILITRPLPQAISTKVKLHAIGYKSKIYPLLEVEFLDFTLEDIFDYVVLTSQNAARALCTRPVLRAHALVVGDTARAYLQQHGYNVAFTTSDAGHLYKKITLNLSKDSSILYISGDHVAFQLVKKLTQAGYKVTQQIVYKAKALPHLPSLHNIETILFYSPRTAKIFKENSQVTNYNMNALCISKNTAGQLEGLKFNALKIAAAPNEDSMLELLNER